MLKYRNGLYLEERGQIEHIFYEFFSTHPRFDFNMSYITFDESTTRNRRFIVRRMDEFTEGCDRAWIWPLIRTEINLSTISNVIFLLCLFYKRSSLSLIPRKRRFYPCSLVLSSLPSQTTKMRGWFREGVAISRRVGESGTQRPVGNVAQERKKKKARKSVGTWDLVEVSQRNLQKKKKKKKKKKKGKQAGGRNEKGE